MQLKIPFNILLKMHLLVIQYWTVLRGFLELSCKSNSTESTYRQLKKAQNSLITWKKKSISGGKCLLKVSHMIGISNQS